MKIYANEIKQATDLLEKKRRSEVRKGLNKTAQLRKSIQDTEKVVEELESALIPKTISQIKVLEREKKEILEQISQGQEQLRIEVGSVQQNLKPIKLL